jgi:hypothetical protein
MTGGEQSGRRAAPGLPQDRRDHAAAWAQRALGLEMRQLGSMRGEHRRQRGRQILPQMEAVGHLMRQGSPEARRFGVCLRPNPYAHLDPGMGLKPRGHGGSFPIGKQGERPPPFQVQQDGAIGMTLPQRAIVHAEDLRGDDRGAGGAADYPQQRVATHQEAEVPTEPHPGRPTQREAHGKETCLQPQRAPYPRPHKARQSLGEDAAGALPIGAEDFTDAKLPSDGIATPGKIGERPGVMTMDTRCWDIASRAAGCCLYGRDQEGDLGVRVIDMPGVQSERYGLRS